MTQYHHRSAKKIGNQILSSWKSEQIWRSSFIGNDAQLCMSEGVFPSPDRTFRDLTKKTRVLLEFKPYTENKRGILTGLGQCIAYLNKSHASILVAPSKIKEENGEDFDMGTYLETTFKKFIYGKLPIALFTFDGENLDNLTLRCNFDNGLYQNLKEFKFKDNEPFWAWWRDWPLDAFYKLLQSSQIIKDKNNRSKKVWDHYFFNYYAPKETLETLELLPSNVIGLDGEKMIPFETIKKKLSNDVKVNKITNNEAIKLLKKEWNEDEIENPYKNYKKNHVIFLDHTKMWDEDFMPTKLGNKFLDRVEKFSGNQEKLKDEFAQILLVEGNHHDFIEEIEEITSSLDKKNNDKEYLNDLYLSLDKKGFIAKNPNRATSGSRRFLTAEKQLWGHLDIIKKDGARYFFKDQGYFFRKERIENLIEEFYKNYGKETERVLETTNNIILN